MTLTAATYQDKAWIIEMDTDELTDGQPWVTLEIDNTASQLFVAAFVIVSKVIIGWFLPAVATTTSVEPEGGDP